MNKLSEGKVQVYTGNGKGKTTAALGLMLRAAGAGMDIYFGQFMKTGDTSEAEALRRRAKESLNLTIGEIGATFDLLTLQRFQPVLENIIHLGLSATVEEIQLPPKQRRKRYP